MATDIDALSHSDTGAVQNTFFEEAVIARARALAAEGKVDGRWVRPLERAIARERLRVPVFPATVSRVIELVEAVNVDLAELADVVSQDPGLAARVIGVANSSYFRGATDVENVRDALMRMGIREARTIIIVVSLRSVVLRSIGQGSDATSLWRHSLLTAAVAQEVSAERPPWEQVGFLAGVLHDLGRLILHAYFADLEAAGKLKEESGEPAAARTMDRMMCDLHASLGAYVLATWGFAEPFCLAVLHHEEASACEGPAGDLALVLEFSNRLAQAIEQGWPEGPEEIAPELIAFAETLGYTPEMLWDLAIDASASFEALAKIS